MADRQMVSIMKACELAGVSRRTIYNWIAANKVEYLRTADGSIRIFVDTLWRGENGEKLPIAPEDRKAVNVNRITTKGGKNGLY